MPIVVNIKTYTPKQKDIYIGRSGRYPSPLANPYTHIQSGLTRAEHVVATQEESIECYRAWLQEKIAKRDPAVMYELQRITAQTQLEGTSMYVVLICATCFEEGRDTRITVPYDSDTQQIQYPVGWYRDRCPQCNAKRMLENAYRPHTPYTGDTNDND